MNRLPPVVIEVLKQLNVLTPEELKALDAYHLMDNLNDVGQKVGSNRPVFRLTRV
jgi:hypothetical protein